VHAAAEKFSDRLFQQRIMRAAKNQSIDAALFEAFEIRFDRHFDDLVVRPTFLDQRDEERTSPAVDLD